MDSYELKVIARIRSDFQTKFGIPRQSGLVRETRAELVFEPPYRDREALRGIEGNSHLWLIWQFSENLREGWSPTVRPPRLGGNVRMGVFATRAPFRPNALGLSCVELLGLREDAHCGTVLLLGGADLMDGTPVFDIKPYSLYADCHPDAHSDFASTRPEGLQVDFPAALLARLPEEKREACRGVLALDPRPRYQADEARIYGMNFAGFDVRFQVRGGVVCVVDVCSAAE